MRAFLSISPFFFAFVFVTARIHAATLQVPEDFPTIQAALDKAQPQDLVLVGPGTYHEQLQLRPGVTLRSRGSDDRGKRGLKRAEAAILDGKQRPSESAGVSMAAGAVLDGFTVTNFGKYDGALWQKHFDTQGNEQSHEHLGEFRAPAVGVDAVDCVVKHCIVHHNGNTGIAIQGQCSPTIESNACYRNMGGGIGSLHGSSAWIRKNICFENFYAGIGHAGASPVVTENECYGNIRAGIGISEGSSPVVRGNTCYQNRRAGIGIRTGDDTRPVVVDNVCRENAMAGIGVREAAAPLLRGNRCFQNGLAGIGARDNANPILVENECSQNETAGIGLDSADRPILARNTSTENKTAGIGIRGTTQATLIDNQCRENRLVAIGLPDGASAVMIGNTCQRTGGMPPLVAIKGGAQATLVKNELHGGGVATVLLEGTGTLLGNQLRSANPGQGNGVWLWKGSHGTAIGNEMLDYKFSLRLADEATWKQYDNTPESSPK